MSGGRATTTACFTSSRRSRPTTGSLNHIGRQTFFVADGHHRYETALAYQAEIRADPAPRVS